MKISLNEYEQVMSATADRLREVQDLNRELLRALEAVAAYDRTFPHVLSGDVPHALNQMTDKVKAAIRKAKGEL